MRCADCPLFSWWDNEDDKGASCGLFGDSWDSRFQYEDEDGNIVGCYIDRHYIEQTEEKYEEHLEEQVKSYLEWEAKHEYPDKRHGDAQKRMEIHNAYERWQSLSF